MQGGQGYYLGCFEVRGSGRQAQDRVGGWLVFTCCEGDMRPSNIVGEVYLVGGESEGRGQVRQCTLVIVQELQEEELYRLPGKVDCTCGWAGVDLELEDTAEKLDWTATCGRVRWVDQAVPVLTC